MGVRKTPHYFDLEVSPPCAVVEASPVGPFPFHGAMSLHLPWNRRLCAADPGCDLSCVPPLGQSCCDLHPVLDAQVAPILFFLHLSVFSFSGSRQKVRLWSHGNGRAATQIAKLNSTIRFAKESSSPNLYKDAFTFSSDKGRKISRLINIY